MHTIFDISRYAKGHRSENQAQEDLITGILVWCMERETDLFSQILAESYSVKDKPTKDEEFEFDLQFTLRGDGTQEERGRVDVIATSDNQRILIENKIVPESITVEQVIKYHELADQEEDKRPCWVLIITPDHQRTIEERIFNKLNRNYRDKTLWLSWLEVYKLCKRDKYPDSNLKSTHDNLISAEFEGTDPATQLGGIPTKHKSVLIELTEALKMQGIKPFEGFSSDVEKLSELKHVGEFFNLLIHKLEEETIAPSRRNNDAKFSIENLEENFLYCIFSDGRVYKEVRKDIFYLMGFNFDSKQMVIDIRWNRRSQKITKLMEKFLASSGDIKKINKLINEEFKDIKATDCETENEPNLIFGVDIPFNNLLSNQDLVKQTINLILIYRKSILEKYLTTVYKSQKTSDY